MKLFRGLGNQRSRRAPARPDGIESSADPVGVGDARPDTEGGAAVPDHVPSTPARGHAVARAIGRPGSGPIRPDDDGTDLLADEAVLRRAAALAEAMGRRPGTEAAPAGQGGTPDRPEERWQDRAITHGPDTPKMMATDSQEPTMPMDEPYARARARSRTLGPSPVSAHRTEPTRPFSGPGGTGEGDADPGSVGSGSDGAGASLHGPPADTPFAARARMASRPRSQPKRRIWDLEEEASAGPAPRGTPRRDRAEEGHAGAASPRPGPEARIGPEVGTTIDDAPGVTPGGAPASVPGAVPDGQPDAEDVARAREHVARLAQGSRDGTPQTAPTGRAKTRLLGFQSRGMGPHDPFADPGRDGPQPGPRFPVGWLVVVEGPGRGASFALTGGVASIGRGADQAIALDFGDTAISRQNHASIAYDETDNRFFLGHGGKANLVRLNGRPVVSTEDLADADEIRIGETALRFVALCGGVFSWQQDDRDAYGPQDAARDANALGSAADAGRPERDWDGGDRIGDDLIGEAGRGTRD